jgi:hypothetical protein
VPKDHPQYKKASEYWFWAMANGIEAKNLSLRFKNANHPYMIATRDMKKGEIIVSVPYENWQPLEKVMAHSPILQKLNEAGSLVKHLSHPWRNSFFAVFMIEQLKKGKESDYYPYISNFNDLVDHYPTNFGDKEKELLKGCDDLLFKCESKNIIDGNDYTLLTSVCPELKDTCSLEEFKTAKKWVSTRAYGLAFTDGEQRQVLVPFLEFA